MRNTLKKIDQYLSRQDSFIPLSLFFVVIGVILFTPSLHYDFFIIDDDFHRNIGNFSEKGFSSLAQTWTESKTPLINNIWQLTGLLFGNETASYFRVINIFFHFVNFSLLYLLLKYSAQFFKIQVNQNFILISAAIFLIHPIQVENIVWVSGLNDILSLGLAFLSVICWLKGIRDKDNFNAIFFPVVFFSLAILTKPTTAALPFVIFFFALFSRDKKPLVRSVATLFICFLSLSTLAYYYHSYSLINEILTLVSKEDRFYLVLNSINHYLKSHVLPFNLYVVYDLGILKISKLSSQASLFELFIKPIPFLMVLFAAIYSFFKSKKSSHYIFISCAVTIYILGLLPILGVFPFDFQVVSTVSDRYAYFSTSAISFLILYFYSQSSNSIIRAYATNIVIFLIFILFSSITVKQVYHWQSSSTILGQNPQKSYYHRIYYLNSLMKDGHYKQAYRLGLDIIEQYPDKEEAHQFFATFFSHLLKENLVDRINSYYRSYKSDIPIYLYEKAVENMVNARADSIEVYRYINDYFNLNPSLPKIDELQELRIRKGEKKRNHYLFYLARYAYFKSNYETLDLYLQIIEKKLDDLSVSDRTLFLKYKSKLEEMKQEKSP